jgi:hypothetical protein
MTWLSTLAMGTLSEPGGVFSLNFVIDGMGLAFFKMQKGWDDGFLAVVRVSTSMTRLTTYNDKVDLLIGLMRDWSVWWDIDDALAGQETGYRSERFLVTLVSEVHQLILAWQSPFRR